MSEHIARGPFARSQGRRNTTAPTISVVIPARNEAANLPAVIARLPKDLFEVILVDGNSTDGTIEVARELVPSVRVFQQEGRGKGDALAVGFAAVRGDIIVMLDADGSADAAEIPRFVAALVAGADFVKGSRFAQGGGSTDITATRRLGNRVLCGVVNRAYGMNYTDLCYGYNAFWADCLPALRLAWPGSPLPAAASPFGTGFEVETTMNIRAAKAGLTVWEVPSFERPRIFGHSNLNAVRDGLRILRAIWEERPGRALRRERVALAGLSLPPDVTAPVPAPAAPADRLVLQAPLLATGEFLATVPHHESVNGNGHAPSLSRPTQ
jgi:glycosyltransferase involved in cell wall biosynthesis